MPFDIDIDDTDFRLELALRAPHLAPASRRPAHSRGQGHGWREARLRKIEDLRAWRLDPGVARVLSAYRALLRAEAEPGELVFVDPPGQTPQPLRCGRAAAPAHRGRRTQARAPWAVREHGGAEANLRPRPAPHVRDRVAGQRSKRLVDLGPHRPRSEHDGQRVSARRAASRS
jgi:hypothetical protein